MMAKPTVFGFAKMLADAGVVTQERLNNITRIVIDVNPSEGGVFIYTEEIGDSEALAKLAPMLKGMIPGA